MAVLPLYIIIGRALEGDWDYLRSEIKALTRTCHDGGAIIKVILETAYVGREEDISTLCHICTEEGADFVTATEAIFSSVLNV